MLETSVNVSVKSTINEAVISTIIPIVLNQLPRDPKWTTLLKLSVKKMGQSNLCGKNLLMERNIGTDDKHLINFTQIVKKHYRVFE